MIHAIVEQMPQQKIEINANIPNGFEATGEYRRARPGEYILDGNKVFCPHYTSTMWHIILRKVSHITRGETGDDSTTNHN